MKLSAMKIVPAISALLIFSAVNAAASTERYNVDLDHSIVGFSVAHIVVSAFYSLQDTRTPVRVAAVALAANVVLSLALMEPLAHAGVALATALSAILNMAVLVVLLNRRLGPFDWDEIARSHMRVLLAAVPIVVTCVWVAGLGIWTQPEAWVAKTVMLIVGIGISVAGYVTVHALLHSDELDFLWGLLKRKFARPAA